MNKQGPIVVIDDDADDRETLAEVFGELQMDNAIRFFSTGKEALAFLQDPQVKPFLLISDINMPEMDGFQLRTHVLTDEVLRHKCIPYIFLTTGATPMAVKKAYEHSAQGIFAKPSLFSEWSLIVGDMVRYWQTCIAPNRLNEK